jgi:cephalosporin hydroxylase
MDLFSYLEDYQTWVEVWRIGHGKKSAVEEYNQNVGVDEVPHHCPNHFVVLTENGPV